LARLIAALVLVLVSVGAIPTPGSLAPTRAAVLATGVQQDPATQTVYITRTGDKYHRDGCRYLSRSKIPVSLKEAVGRGYGPCSVCKPPTIRTP
jgi:hypothetical protein